jgi:hypothetical protein
MVLSQENGSKPVSELLGLAYKQLVVWNDGAASKALTGLVVSTQGVLRRAAHRYHED